MRKHKYVAVLIAPDGEFVTDFKRDTIEEVEKELADMGSKWIFYNNAFAIIRCSDTINKIEILNRRIISTDDQLSGFENKKLGTLIKAIKRWETEGEVCSVTGEICSTGYFLHEGEDTIFISEASEDVLIEKLREMQAETISLFKDEFHILTEKLESSDETNYFSSLLEKVNDDDELSDKELMKVSYLLGIYYYTQF